jgi:hypothetical protein
MTEQSLYFCRVLKKTTMYSRQINFNYDDTVETNNKYLCQAEGPRCTQQLLELNFIKYICGQIHMLQQWGTTGALLHRFLAHY